MTDSERMQEAKDFAIEVARDVFPDLPKFYFKWSKRLTTTAGRIIWRNRNTDKEWVEIKLANKIFWKVVEEQGIDKACEQIHQTMLHELGHMVEGHPGHGFDWQNAVISMGGNPEQFHDMTCGKGLIDNSLRLQFPIGSLVQFSHKGQEIVGRVEKHNPKNIKIRPSNSRAWWNMPWAIAGSRLSKH